MGQTIRGNSEDVMTDRDRIACASQYMGPWAIEIQTFLKLVEGVKSGLIQAQPQIRAQTTSGDRKPFAFHPSGLAVIPISGQLQKGDSKFGGTSTILTRRQIRQAVADSDVRGIMLVVDSPGGTAAGTEELAGEVMRARQAKPVRVHVDDLAASAAFWVASQAERITANRTALVGSIGTIAVLEDTSQRAEMEGIKVHVISTGAFKGVGIPGTEVTDEQIKFMSEIVGKINDEFLGAVKVGRGRRLSRERLMEAADGRVFLAQDARDLGLIDEVLSQDDAMGAFRVAIAPKRRRRTQQALLSAAIDQESSRD